MNKLKEIAGVIWANRKSILKKVAVIGGTVAAIVLVAVTVKNTSDNIGIENPDSPEDTGDVTGSNNSETVG
jgi:hypothetical protein